MAPSIPTSDQERVPVDAAKATGCVEDMALHSVRREVLETSGAGNDLLSVYGLALENDAQYRGEIEANRAARGAALTLPGAR